MKNHKHTDFEHITINNEIFFKISNVDSIRPFFMSIVSASDHWMFIGSNGGISAGRKNSDHALFPYYTDDKIIESAESTGSKTIFRVIKDNQTFVWEPFSIHFSTAYSLQRNLYKNSYGNKILFEEINEDLGLTFQYQWSNSDRFGFIKTSTLINHNTSAITISTIDGIQNIIPYGVSSALQNSRSNLVDAYKRHELDRESGIGIFALSAIIVDKAEPSEALKATIAWSLGLDNVTRLLSASQLSAFRNGLTVHEETDVKAERGAYFVQTTFELVKGASKEWMIIADVNQSVAQIMRIRNLIQQSANLRDSINQDITKGTHDLIQLNAAADGLQLTSDLLRDTRHFANTTFNIMRGGIFDRNYYLDKSDFQTYLTKANRHVYQQLKSKINTLPDSFSVDQLINIANEIHDADFKRLSLEYLPLKFSRRHGDPSRPWNQFSINLRNEKDGTKVLNYEGNWRDIFQNWEALAHAYPGFLEGMIFKFLNASTFDGYNPYRITKNGIDWEKIEADDPWSYIGYWGDHQVIYLLKFLESSENHQPGKLEQYFNESVFVYANVPYKIKSYQDILKNPKDTIDFDHQLDDAINKRWQSLGSDSALLQNQQGDIYHVNFIEKIVATVIAKLSNFIPEGGIWMNTQRPEWNDANNALVGNGVSVVTLCYLRRFLAFFQNVLSKSKTKESAISDELLRCFQTMHNTLRKHEVLLSGTINNHNKKVILDALGNAASAYRNLIYQNSFSGAKSALVISELVDFLTLTLRYVEHSIAANKRSDKLYHAYNLMTIEDDHSISITYLSEMLEGQVAALSSGYCTASEAVELLDSLRASQLYRKDQQSYLLYPNKQLPGFLQKNTISDADVQQTALLRFLSEKGNNDIIEQDVYGNFHFNGNFKNASDLSEALSTLNDLPNTFTEADKQRVLSIFEKVFQHKAFTGRSGTFFGYEGLGSIYWHMVSKLLLAVRECCLQAMENHDDQVIIDKLIQHFHAINEGIGVHKSPSVYGAFPTDPYSHTPANKGAQQPGMTGQVKEDILARFGELGIRVKNGQLSFNPFMLRKTEFMAEPKSFQYVDVNGNNNELTVPENALCFTYCQVPILYVMSDNDKVEVITSNNQARQVFQALTLDIHHSQRLFFRTGEIKHIEVFINKHRLR